MRRSVAMPSRKSSIEQPPECGLDHSKHLGDLPFRFTGKIDKLSIKVGPSQLSEAEQLTAAETIQKDSD
jgi:hypothetical protein